MFENLPSYEDLAGRTDGRPPGSAWGVFGDDDEVGTINLLTADRVLAAQRLVMSGDVHSLNWQIDLPSPHPWRPTPQRTHIRAGIGRDDFLSPMYLQFSTQWDGLRHIESPDGFYNGVPASVVDDLDSTRLGIDVWARRGIVGCGVLLDVERACAQLGTPIDEESSFAISPALLEQTAALQDTAVHPGDVLLIRTGWVGWYAALPEEQREQAYRADSSQPGLEPSEGMAGWLWDHHVAAVAADNSALERQPLDFTPGHFLHTRLIAGFGMPIGEHFWLDGLATACESDRRWRFMFASAPLNVLGGVGSPPNALAIR